MNTRAIPITFGTKLSVISWIWVTACSRDTNTPTARATSSRGPASRLAMIMASVMMSMTWASFTSSSDHRGDQGARQQAPPVHQDEQEQLERQGHEHRRQHHHAERHQHRRHHQV